VKGAETLCDEICYKEQTERTLRSRDSSVVVREAVSTPNHLQRRLKKLLVA